MSGLNRRYRRAIAGLSLAALLGACSGSAAAVPPAASSPGQPGQPVSATQAAARTVGATTAPDASSGQSAGACTVVTNDAVGTAGGFTVAAAVGTDSICFFQNADKSKYLNVTLYGNQADMAPMLQIEAGSEHIAGLGDDAFWTGTGILFARMGDHAIELFDPDLAGVGPAGAAFRDALTLLARAALPSL